ncbi:YbfB/YjiJ family MFS transporter [Acinetobacter soli]|uniref:YbfB/YjiJ family MFS transporter n=1 Tax=Acinetobacter soli TaxID=487316 RepID=UPI000DCFA0C7|nr:YbfB/YjiJ family MFS transporter [Acinetobacter soli]RSB58203.1 YbfB/YjiJ family MFS transporter [Acinetobacter soli]
MTLTASSPRPAETLLILFAGISSLIVAHGLGRFAFTPLLPYLIQDNVITLAQGANLATWNYIGYLVGALVAVSLHARNSTQSVLIWALLVNAGLTILQIITTDYTFFLLLRLCNGITNGLVFVLVPALILEWLAEHHKTQLSGLMFTGVSIGLILDSILIDWSSAWFSGQLRWIPIGLVALPLALFSVWQLKKITLSSRPIVVIRSSRLLDRNSTPLFIGYAGAGLGYILPMTFLPTLAHELIRNQPFILANIWLITALSCLILLPFWNKLGASTNDRFALICSYIVQILSLIAVLIFHNAIGVVICAILMGGSFMGTVVCSQRIARIFQPHQGPKLYAALISLYAGTQLIGPWLAKLWIDHGGTLLQSFYMGLAALIWGLLWTLRTPNPANVVTTH